MFDDILLRIYDEKKRVLLTIKLTPSSKIEKKLSLSTKKHSCDE